MASIINASTSGVGGVITTADNSGILNIQTAGTTAITVNASQNVGVGVTPSPWVGYKVMQAGLGSFAGGSSGAYLISDNAYTDNSGAGWKYINSSYAPAQYYAASGAHVWRTAPSGTAGNAITFTQAMTLDASGNLLVGTTTQADTGKQSVRFNGLIQKGIGIQDSENASGARFISFVGAGGGSIGSIERVGITNAVVYNTTSDLRLKSNIVDADPVLDKLMQVQVRQYDWTEGDLHQDYGFIAQELEPVLSGIVTKGKTEEDMWQLDYSRLTPHLVKAMQEQQAMIQELKAEIDLLKGVK